MCVCVCDQQHQQQGHLTVAGSDSAILVRWFCVVRLGSMMALLTAATALRQRRRPVSCTSPSSSLINTALFAQSAHHHPHHLSSTRLCWSCSPARCSSANQQASRDHKPASLPPRATYRIGNESVPIPLLLNYITYSFNHNRQTAGIHENKPVFTPSNIKVDKHHNTSDTIRRIRPRHHLLPYLNPDWFYLSGTGSPG